MRLKRCMRVARTVERLDAAKSVAHDKITSRSGDKGRRRLIRASPGGRRSRSSSERRCQSTFDCRRDTPMTGYKRRSRQNGQRTARLGASRAEHTRCPPCVRRSRRRTVNIRPVVIVTSTTDDRRSAAIT